MADALEQLDDAYSEHGPNAVGSGHTMLFRWFKDGPWGEAASHVIKEFVVFYTMLLLGFGFLYFMLRNTTKLREIRRDVADALRAQQQRKFDLDNYSSMAYGGIA